MAQLLKKCYKVAMLSSKREQGYLAILVIAVAAALLAVSGCGGDDDTAAGTGPVAAQEDGEGGSASGGGAPSSEEAEGEGGGEGEGGEGGAGAVGGEAAGGVVPGDGGSAGGGNGNGASAGGGKAGLQAGTAKSRSGKKRRSGGGGSGGGGGGETVPPGAAEFLEQADAICKEKRENTRQNISDYTSVGLGNLEKNAEEIVNKLVIPNLEAEMQEIQALNPPASASGAVTALFSAIEEMIATGKADPEGFILTGEAVSKSEEIAKSNGFTVCGGI